MSDILDGYERVLIQSARVSTSFIYALHFTDANHIQIGFGNETKSGLQRSHIAGPNVHEAHIEPLAEWLDNGGGFELTDLWFRPRIHPFSSTMDVNFHEQLLTHQHIPLYAGKYLAIQDATRLDQESFRSKFAAALRNIKLAVFPHPLDWEVEDANLNDGRFVWMAFDADLNKIRLGLGFYDEHNTRRFGEHTYALAWNEIASFVAHHFTMMDAPLQFLGLPSGWPTGLTYFVSGTAKQAFAEKLLHYADKVWPGKIQ